MKIISIETACQQCKSPAIKDKKKCREAQRKDASYHLGLPATLTPTETPIGPGIRQFADPSLNSVSVDVVCTNQYQD